MCVFIFYIMSRLKVVVKYKANHNINTHTKIISATGSFPNQVIYVV